MKVKARFAALLALSSGIVGTHAALASAATTGHSQTIEVRCTSSGFVTDANAFNGQRTEVTAFYNATGITCRIFDGETGALLYDPSA